jgi:tripartite-type tricarboxylate transporter receptor subunit TctC
MRDIVRPIGRRTRLCCRNQTEVAEIKRLDTSFHGTIRPHRDQDWQWESLMPLLQRILGILSSVAFTVAIGSVPTGAQESRGPITMLVGYPAGGSADLTARIVAEGLSSALGRTVVVESRVGAGGQIAARALKSAAADGSVVFMTNSHTVVTVPLVMKEVGFSTLTDFTPITNIATYVLALAVHPKTNATTLEAYVKWLKANPQEANIAIPAAASSPEFMVDRMKRRFDVAAQTVSYRGSAPAMKDLLGVRCRAQSCR